MKNNTETGKQHLTQALHALSQDESLNEARYHVRLALQKIEQVEKKRARRAEAASQQSWQEQARANAASLQAGVNTPKVYDVDRRVWIIDQMISEEKKKLEELSRKSQQKGQQQKHGDSQTLND